MRGPLAEKYNRLWTEWTHTESRGRRGFSNRVNAALIRNKKDLPPYLDGQNNNLNGKQEKKKRANTDDQSVGKSKSNGVVGSDESLGSNTIDKKG